jgi:phage baseplate assembly protein W
MAVVNLKFPLQPGQSDGYFELTQTTLETIKQNLMLFFASDEGERVVRNELGSRFRRYLFEPDIPNIRSKCESEVNRIFANYFPQLNLDSLQVETVPDNTMTSGGIKINISYSFKNLGAVNDSLIVVIG